MLAKQVLRSVAYAIAVPWLSTVISAVQAQNLPVRSGVIIARIESNKSEYRLGERIKLRLTLINTTGQRVLFLGAAPYEVSSLKIFNARGQPLSPTSAPGPCICEGRPYSIPLEPRKPLVVQYNDRYSNGALREWADIQDWGYDLRRVGNYTISVSATIMAIEPGGPEFKTSSVGRSNAIHISITN